MNIRPLPKSWLIHTIKYEEYQGEDDWEKPSFGESVTIEHVRYDDSTVFSRDTTQTKILADAVIFVDSTHSTNIPEKFVQESKITLVDKSGKTIKTCTLKKDVPCYYPNKNEVHHWELEVV